MHGLCAQQHCRFGDIPEMPPGKACLTSIFFGVQDKQGNTALHLAASSHGENAVTHLLAMPGAREAVTIVNRAHQTALHVAAARGSPKDVHRLLAIYPEGRGIEDRLGLTPLQAAAKLGHTVSPSQSCLDYWASNENQPCGAR